MRYSYKGLFLLGCSVLLSGCTTMQGKTNEIAGMFQRFASTFPSLWALLSATATLMGLLLIARAVVYLKIYGQSQTMMSGQSNLKIPLILFVCGAALIYLPSTGTSVTETLFGAGNPAAWTPPAGSDIDTVSAILLFVKLIGGVAFVRGWIQLSHTATMGGGDPKTFSKALTHIVGGILAINIGTVIQVLQNTFG